MKAFQISTTLCSKYILSRPTSILSQTRKLHKEYVSWASKLPFAQFQELLHNKFTIETDLEQKYPELGGTGPHKVASVTLAFYEKDDDIHVLMIKRASKGLHGGQIAFPGGKKDPEDATFVDTALRETYEEVGVLASDHNLQIIGNLKPIQSNLHKFTVVPFIATLFTPPSSGNSPSPSSSSSFASSFVPSPLSPLSPKHYHVRRFFPPFTVQESEVDYIIEPTLKELADGYIYYIPNKATDDEFVASLQLDPPANLEWPGWRGPIFVLPNPLRDVIWGLSAKILVDFFTLLKPK